MLNFELLPGDKYDGRCAEIYITEKQFLIYHCSVCDEIYAKFNELLSHITKDHYEYTKEYSEMETRNVETFITQENYEETQVAAKDSFVKANKSNKCVDASGDIGEAKAQPETENIPTLSNSNTTLPQRRKYRTLTGMLKNYTMGRTRINTLTRQVNCNEEQKYICGICGFAFKEKYNFRCHLLRHSNRKKHTCSICPKKLFTKIELRLHENRHKGEQPYLCNHCGMGFQSWGSFARHIRKHHNIDCEQSDKVYSNFNHLKNYTSVHMEVPGFQCGDCPSKFKYNKTLNSHMKLHENKSKIPGENCDLEFDGTIGLEKERFLHESAQTLSKRYFLQCKSEDCTDMYVKSDSLREETIKNYQIVPEQNFDEYELVQTLTDLECNKNM